MRKIPEDRMVDELLEEIAHMSQKMKNIVVLGSTGSIGKNTLEVVRNLKDKFRVIGLSSNSRWEL